MWQTHLTPPPALVEQFNAYFQRQWNPLVRVSDVPDDRPMAVRLLDRPLAVMKLNGNYVVMDDLCRHFQAALSLGEVERLECGQQVLRCKYHGWAYDTTGKCVEIPQLPQGRSIPGDAKVTTYPSVVKHGVVWVSIEEPKNAVADIPLAVSLSGLHLLPMQITRWDCSAIRMILSALDDYHFAFLHEGVLGDRSHPAAPDRVIKRDDNALISTFSVTQPANVTNSPEGFADATATVDYTMRVDMPNVISLVKTNPRGVYIIWFAACPRSCLHTDVFWTVARSYDLGPESDARVLAMELMIQSQDRPVIASQRPWASTPLPIREVDDALVEYLRWLKELGCPNTM
jgi:phenylpropionate dioxygenase-like ring-hydroxylating dioxygenase large terminal subunit